MMYDVRALQVMLPASDSMFIQSDSGCINCGNIWSDIELEEKATNRVCQKTDADHRKE